MRCYNGKTGLGLRRQVVSLLTTVFVAVAATVYSSAAYAESLPAGAERHLYVGSLPKVTWVATMVAPFGKSLGASAGAVLPQSNVITDAAGDKWTVTGSTTTVSSNGVAMLAFSPGSSLQTSISGGSSVTATAAMSLAGPTAACLMKLIESDDTSLIKLVSNNGTLALVTRQKGGAPTSVSLPYSIHTNQSYVFTMAIAPSSGHSKVTVTANNKTLPPVTVQLGQHFVASMDRLVLGGAANNMPVYVSEAAFYQTSVDVASLTNAEIVRDDITLPPDAPAVSSGSGATPASTNSGGSTASASGASSSGSTSGSHGTTSSSGSSGGSSSGSSSGSASGGSSSSSGGNSSGGRSSSGSGSSSGSSGSSGGTGGSSGGSGGSSGSGGSTGATGGGGGSGGSGGGSGSGGSTGGTGGIAGAGGSAGSGGSTGGAGGSSGSGGTGGVAGTVIVCDDNSQNNYLNGQSNPSACYDSTTGAWTGNSNNAWGAELSYSNSPGATFTWTTNQVQPVTSYVIQVSTANWGPTVPNSSAAQYTIYDGNTQVASVTVNQQLTPTGPTYNGVQFATLTNITPTTNTISVKVTNNAPGTTLVADAIRIAPPGSPPSAQFGASPSSGSAGSTFQVSFSNQLGGTAPYTYSYDFGNTGVFAIQNSSNATAMIPGSYVNTPNTTLVVRGRILDSAGDYTDYITNILIGASGYIRTPYLNIPDFALNPACTHNVPPVVSVASGNWSNSATWSGGQVPGAGTIVQIAAGTAVTYDVNDSTDSVPFTTVEVGGTLTFSTSTNTQMLVQTLLVLSGGVLNIGTQANPVPANIEANVVWVNQSIDTSCDPEQYSHGLIVFGTMNTYGALITPYAQLAQEAHAGDTLLHLAAVATGWAAGQRVQLPDSNAWSQANVTSTFANTGVPLAQWEQAIIQSVSANGLTVTLTAPLQYNHPGPHDVNGNVIVDPTNNNPLLPHALNMSRNVSIHSQSPTGVRGYALFTANAKVDIEYTAFTGMGRTTDVNAIASQGAQLFDNTTFDQFGNVNHIGTNEQNRDAITFLDLIGPATPQNNGFTQPGTNPPVDYQFTFNSNVVTCPLTPMPFVWGINVVNSYYGLIQNNNVVNWAGAGIMVDGVSSYNMLNGNFVMRINGEQGRGEEDQGMGGDGFWMGNANNYFLNNIVSTIVTTNVGAYGYGIEIYEMPGISESGGDTRYIAAYQGADPSQPGQSQAVNMSALPILQFANNTVYGLMPYGGSNWWTHYPYLSSPAGSGGTFEHQVVWNVFNTAWYGYQSSSVIFDKCVFAEDYAEAFQQYASNDVGYGFSYQDYDNQNQTIQNSYFMNMGTSSPVSIGNYFTFKGNTVVNGTFSVSSLWSVNADSRTENSGQPYNVILENNNFVSAGQSLLAVNMPWNQPFQWGSGQVNLTGVPVNVLVYNNNNTNQNFQLYYYQQAMNFPVPPSLWAGGVVGGQDETVVGAQQPNGTPIGTINFANPADTTGGPGGTPWVTNQYLVGIGTNPVGTYMVPGVTANVVWNPAANNWDISGVNPATADGMTLNPPVYGLFAPIAPCTGSGC